MHWLTGMLFVNLCSIGWPGWFRGIIGSGFADVPRLPYLAYGPEWTGDRSLA